MVFQSWGRSYLVLSRGLSVLNVKISVAVFSDHMLVLFDFVLRCYPAKSCASAWHYHVFNPSTAALDSAAPLKIRQPKAKSEPWLNDDTCPVRQECRRADQWWKKNRLQVSYK